MLRTLLLATAVFCASATDHDYTCGDVVEFTDGVCGTGMSQSPININPGTTTEIPASDLKLQMKYPAGVAVTWDGAKWNIHASGDAHVLAMNQKFNLIQFHVHSPSEHNINGAFLGAEVHFVHQNPSTLQLLVVGIKFSGTGSAESPFLEQLAFSAMNDDGKTKYYVDMDVTPMITNVQHMGYYTYMGSLTAGSCAENLIWIVSEHIEPASQAQICDYFDNKEIFATSRPVQPYNGREISHSAWYYGEVDVPTHTPAPSCPAGCVPASRRRLLFGTFSNPCPAGCVPA